MTTPDVVLLSVRSPHVERLLDGSKTIELRRRPLRLAPGTVVLLYAAGERKALVGSVVACEVDEGTPHALWRRHRLKAGLSYAEFKTYFAGATVGYALSVQGARALEQPIPLAELRNRWAHFLTPQTHRRIESAELHSVLNGERSQLLPSRADAAFD